MASRPCLLLNSSNQRLSLSRKIPFISEASLSTSRPYVLDLVPFSSSYAALGSDSWIKFFDKQSLQLIREICPSGKGENDRVISIASSGESGDGIIVAYADGSVGLFDVRIPSNEPQARLKGNPPTMWQASEALSALLTVARRRKCCSVS